MPFIKNVKYFIGTRCSHFLSYLQAPWESGMDRGVNPGGLGSPPIDFGQGVTGDLGVVVGDRGQVVKYYYILSCTRSMFGSGNF